MSNVTSVEDVDVLTPWQENWYKLRANKIAIAGLIVLMMLITSAIFAPLIASHAPNEQFIDSLLAPPFWSEGSKAGFVLGTDDLGRDCLLYTSDAADELRSG